LKRRLPHGRLATTEMMPHRQAPQPKDREYKAPTPRGRDIELADPSRIAMGAPRCRMQPGAWRPRFPLSAPSAQDAGSSRHTRMGTPPRSATYTGRATRYRPRNPTATPLYPLVQHNLETFLARTAEADPMGEGVPFWVERDFRAHLRCGILAHGFARARCEDCGTERLIAFSCRGRGVCPSCNARRMVEVAAHLVDHVLPPLPVRQWVLSLPKRLRPFLYRDRALPGAVLAVLLRAIRSTLCHTSPDAPPNAPLGAV